MTTETVKFNVGGTKYEVSRSLLSNHLDTMLARSASDQWQEDPESEIFIERNGERFQYCLDYLRDDRIMLPLIVSKEAVKNDLKYYGVENINADAIEYYPSKGSHVISAISCVHDLQKLMKEEIHAIKTKLENDREKAEKEMACREAALFCFKKHLETGELTFRFGDNDDVGKSCKNKEMFNGHLSRFGLEIESSDMWIDDNFNMVPSKQIFLTTWST